MKYKVQCSRCLGFFYVDVPTSDDEEYVCANCYFIDVGTDYEDFERGFINE